MKLVSLFIFNPCTSWSPRDIHEYKDSYLYPDEFVEDLMRKEDMMVCDRTIDRNNSTVVVHLDMKSTYSIKHPASNQAHFRAEAVIEF